MSENPEIARFEPHISATAAEREPLVWAVDTRHLPLYWFPRDCPRGTFWADGGDDAGGRGAAARRVVARARDRGVVARPHAGTRPCSPTGSRRSVSSRTRRSAATGSAAPRSSRSRSSRSTTSSAATSGRGSSCASCRTSGRSGTTSPPRRSSSAACGSATRAGQVTTVAWPSGERPLLRDAGSAREAGRRRPRLPDHEEAGRGLLQLAGDLSLQPRRLRPRRPTGRPRARRRRPPRREAGTTPPRPAAARAPSQPRPCNSLVRLGSSARPQTTRRFGSSTVQRSRNSVLRRSASSSVTSRSGSDAASGIPGVPPPLPTSTIGPSKRRTSSRPASASSSRTRRASAGSFSAVRPGVASTPASQRSRRSDVDVARDR